MTFHLVIIIKQRVCLSFHALQKRFLFCVKPATTSLLLGTLADFARGKSELIVENALLRQQLIILHRQIKRPVYRKTDRLLLVLLASMVWTWKQALYLVQPETLLRLPSGAFSLVLEAQIPGALEQAEALARGDQLNQRNGNQQSASSEQSASVVSFSSWIFE